MKKNVAIKLFAAILAVSVMFCMLPISSVTASADTYPLGDVDMNNAVDSSDALLVMRYSVGLATLTPEQIALADVNGDGVADSVDALTILQSACGLCSIDTSSHEQSFTSTKKSYNSYVTEVTELCNKERAKAGLAPLEIDDTLCEAAEERALELSLRCDHIRANGTKWSTILNDHGYNFRCAAENLAGGVKTASEVVEAWMNSEGHRAHILDARYTKIGVGYAYVEGSDFGYYFDQIFAGSTANVDNEHEAKVQMLEFINDARQDNGLEPLVFDTTLDIIAEIRADELTESFNKNRPNGDSWVTLADEYGFDYTWCANQFCRGFEDETDAFLFFMDDNPKFLNAEKGYTKIGIGHAFTSDDKYGNYWIIFVAAD